MDVRRSGPAESLTHSSSSESVKANWMEQFLTGTVRLVSENPTPSRNDATKHPIVIESPVNVYVSVDSVSLPQNWLVASYPALAQLWDSVAHRSFPSAIAWSRNFVSPELQEANPELLGLQVKGKHIAVVGPIVLLATLLYMLVLLLELEAVPRSSFQFWLGFSRRLPAQLFMILSVVIAPAVVSGVVVKNQLSVSSSVAVSIALGIGLFGALCLWRANLITRKGASDATAV